MSSPLPPDRIAHALASLPGWRHEHDALVRDLVFPSFPDAIAFLVRASFEVEALDHHPEWTNVHHRVMIRLHTHSAGGRVTDRDVELAGRLHRLAGG